MIDYDIYYRESLNIFEISKIENIDIFISAFNESERVNILYDKINSKNKYWFIQPEYNFSDQQISHLNEKIYTKHFDESKQVKDIIEYLGEELLDKVLYIDCTGFMRHTLVYLIIKLGVLGFKKINIIYSEPCSYINNDKTQFSELCSEVRAIKGTNFTKRGKKESTIMSIGYDSNLMSQMLNQFEGVELYPLFSFPSLSADMFQQSIIKSSNIQFSNIKNSSNNNRHFAPAHDPFSTAKVIAKLVSKIKSDNISNIYLSPLSTKAQVIGHTYFWWKEHKTFKDEGLQVNITLPIPRSYKSKTSDGVGRIWNYTLEM
ncbi:hypothetical protein [Acinetobacter soli]|uniref:hypothetical protein n=1 Tax=Acinetobacter soli TaxID=487316 RepID=UPI000B4DB337|nr:hypothetical protein [Acinetobacter soli]